MSPAQEATASTENSVQAQGWRHHLPVHPAADLLPPISHEELMELGEDIKARGLQTPVTLLRPKDGGHDVLLDGRSRLDAMHAVGIPVIGDDGKILVRHDTVEEPEHFDPYGYVSSANIHRRHLKAEDRAESIRKLKAARPELSIRAIADKTKISKSTIARALDEVSQPGTTADHPASGPESQPRVTGRDGKSYSAKKPNAAQKPRRLGEHSRTLTPEQTKKVLAEAPRESDTPAPIEKKIANQKLAKVIATLGKFATIKDIEDIDYKERRGAGKACLGALNLNVDELRPQRSRFERWAELVAELRDLQAEMDPENLPENFQQGEQADRLRAYTEIDLAGLDVE
jgi:ParB-like chromosome segregation protein Spo0J